MGSEINYETYFVLSRVLAMSIVTMCTYVRQLYSVNKGRNKVAALMHT